MKGMRKISRGSGFRGALDYLSDNKKGDLGRMIGGNMAGTTPRELSQEFSVVRKLRPDIEKPVWHQALRLPPGERLSDQKWSEIAKNYMDEMGFAEDHPRAHFLHDHHDGQHIHIVASRISLSGKIYLGQNENLKSTRIVSELERQFALKLTLDHEKIEAANPEKRRPKKGEIERAIKTGFRPERLVLQEKIDEALLNARTLQDLESRLAENNITVSLFEQDGVVKGVSFGLGESRFSGSQLGEAYKYQRLVERMKQNDQARNSEKSSLCGGNEPENQRVGTGSEDDEVRTGDRHQQNPEGHQRIAKSSRIGDEKMYKNGLTKSRKTNDFERDESSLSSPPMPMPGREQARFRMYSKNSVYGFYDIQAKRTAFKFDKNNNIVYPVAESQDSATLDEMLRVAKKEFGNQLIVQGDPEFCRRIVERADILGIELANHKDELERIREEIRLSKSDLSGIKNFLSDSISIDKRNSEKNAQALERMRVAERQAADHDADHDRAGERMR